MVPAFQMHVDVHAYMRAYMRADMRADMRVGTCVSKHAIMNTDKCACEVCAGMHTGMCALVHVCELCRQTRG